MKQNLFIIILNREKLYILFQNLYGVSENEIIQSNPGIDINKLSVGIEMAIPKREFMNDQQKFDDSGTVSIFIIKCLWEKPSPQLQNNMDFSVRQLRKENRDLRFPQVGDFVRIPGSKNS